MNKIQDWEIGFQLLQTWRKKSMEMIKVVQKYSLWFSDYLSVLRIYLLNEEF